MNECVKWIKPVVIDGNFVCEFFEYQQLAGWKNGKKEKVYISFDLFVCFTLGIKANILFL